MSWTNTGTAGASTLNVKNGSNFEDTFIVSLVLNSLNWPVTFDLATLANGPYQITVPQGGTVPFDVSVDVPADAQGGDETHLRFLIQSQRTPGLVDTVDMYVAADNIAGVALTPNRTGSTAPGTVIGYEHTLTNNGNRTVTDWSQRSQAYLLNTAAKGVLTGTSSSSDWWTVAGLGRAGEAYQCWGSRGADPRPGVERPGGLVFKPV